MKDFAYHLEELHKKLLLSNKEMVEMRIALSVELDSIQSISDSQEGLKQFELLQDHVSEIFQEVILHFKFLSSYARFRRKKSAEDFKAFLTRESNRWLNELDKMMHAISNKSIKAKQSHEVHAAHKALRTAEVWYKENQPPLILKHYLKCERGQQSY